MPEMSPLLFSGMDVTVFIPLLTFLWDFKREKK